MKRFLKFFLISSTFFCGIFSSSSALAQTTPKIRLVPSSEPVVVGQEIFVEVWVDEAPEVYGIELHLGFDPGQFEVVDLQHGDFFSSDPEGQAFVLQNQADNQLGTIDYALSLLNPAPAVSGSGLVVQIALRAKTGGTATLQLTDVLFGNRDGEKIMATGADLTFEVEAETTAPLAPQSADNGTVSPPDDQGPDTENEPVKSTWLGLSFAFGVVLLVGFGLVIGLGGVGIWWFLARQNR